MRSGELEELMEEDEEDPTMTVQNILNDQGDRYTKGKSGRDPKVP